MSQTIGENILFLEGSGLTGRGALRRGDRFLGVLALIAAAIPPLLVVYDRWLEEEGAKFLLYEFRQRLGLLDQFAWPPYFMLVLVCTLALFVLMWFGAPIRSVESMPATWPAPEPERAPLPQRRCGTVLVLGSLAGIALALIRQLTLLVLPGWELVALLLAYFAGWVLQEIPLARATIALARHGRRYAAYALVHIALVGLLMGYNAGREFRPLPVALLILALLWLVANHKQVHPLFWIVTLALVVTTANLDAWPFAVVGDEFSFYRIARSIARAPDWTSMGQNLFKAGFVYGAHPYISSLLQASIMALSDLQNFGWRLSSIYVVVLSLIFFFAFYRPFVGERIALLAVFFLAGSHYLMTFSKIGYNNTQALLAMGLALAASAWAIQRARPLAYVSVGAAMAFCFYVYPAALYVPVLALLLLFWCAPPSTKARAYLWAMMLLTVVIAIFPLLIQERFWTSRIAGTYLYNPSLGASPATLVANVGQNLTYALFSFLYSLQESHFVTVGYVDPITAGLVLIGMAATLRSAGKDRFFGFLIAGFVILLLLVGASHDRAFPPTTRMFLLLPWFALLAALGARWVAERFGARAEWSRRWPLAISICVVILAVNLYQAYEVSIRRSLQYQGMEELLIQLGQTIAAEDTGEKLELFLVNDPETLHAPALQELLDLYYLPLKLKELRVQHAKTKDLLPLLERNAIIVVSPRLAPEAATAFERLLRGAADSCGMMNMAGRVQFWVWYRHGQASPCPAYGARSIDFLPGRSYLAWMLLAVWAGAIWWQLAGQGVTWQDFVHSLHHPLQDLVGKRTPIELSGHSQ